ncbi:hypothetical protein, partial [Actinospica sp.]|uniref:hypothetical protein n=1 Tax=Actinospica sp. TaxID=1872142 RepID=UPI002BB2A4C2
MGDDEDEVVFLDEDEDLGDAAWLDDERVEGGLHPGTLPPHVSRNRLLVTLVALALFLGGTGVAFTTAYHRHLTDVRIANLFSLASAGYPPQIPDLADLALAASWHAEVRERVDVPVVNQSPQPIVLLGAMLTEPGMVGTASLAPTGATTLKTGQTGIVAGVVTVDCTQNPALGYPSANSDPSFVIPVQPIATLKVRARTSGGRIAEATLDPEAGQGFQAEMQQRICLQQGDNAVSNLKQAKHYDSATHVLTLDVSVTSHADTAMQYTADLSISAPGSDASAPCTAESEHPTTPVGGTVGAESTVTVSFAIQMSACPAGSAPPPTEGLQLGVSISIHGYPLTE